MNTKSEYILLLIVFLDFLLNLLTVEFKNVFLIVMGGTTIAMFLLKFLYIYAKNKFKDDKPTSETNIILEKLNTFPEIVLLITSILLSFSELWKIELLAKIIYSLIIIFNLVGLAFLVVSIIKKKARKTAINLLILSLFISFFIIFLAYELDFLNNFQ